MNTVGFTLSKLNVAADLRKLLEDGKKFVRGFRSNAFFVAMRLLQAARRVVFCVITRQWRNNIQLRSSS